MCTLENELMWVEVKKGQEKTDPRFASRRRLQLQLPVLVAGIKLINFTTRLVQRITQ